MAGRRAKQIKIWDLRVLVELMVVVVVGVNQV